MFALLSNLKTEKNYLAIIEWDCYPFQPVTNSSICIAFYILPKQNIKNTYYSFKIFPQFWLAKSTRIIHYNQLLMTKFGRILCLTRKWRQKCSPLQVKASLPRRPGDEVELIVLFLNFLTLANNLRL